MAFVTLANEGPVSIVTLSRPERLNAIGTALMAELHRALVAAQADPETGAIVLTGAGRAFCAGDDLKEFEQQAATETSVAAMCERIQQITRDIMLGPKLVVGAAHGYAVGGGFEWLLNCDMVVAADDLVAFFPEMGLGHFVTGGVTHLLPQTVGYQRAMELMVLGDRHDAQALHRLGLVNRVVSVPAMLPTALEIAGRIAARSPLATARLKRVMNVQLGAQLAAALQHEQRAAMACFASAETVRRVGQDVRSKTH
jgi:enoyl-CoA hydratase/carnithine racemase